MGHRFENKYALRCQQTEIDKLQSQSRLRTSLDRHELQVPSFRQWYVSLAFEGWRSCELKMTIFFPMLTCGAVEKKLCLFVYFVVYKNEKGHHLHEEQQHGILYGLFSNCGFRLFWQEPLIFKAVFWGLENFLQSRPIFMLPVSWSCRGHFR